MGLIDLAGRSALITGAAKRVGRSIAAALADEGVNVIVHYNTSQAEAESLAVELRDRGVATGSVVSIDDMATLATLLDMPAE